MADKPPHSESDYRAIFNAVNEMIFVHDPHTGQILDVNEKTCSEFGYSREEFKELTVGNISAGVTPYTLKEAVEWVRKAAQGAPQIFEWRCKDRSGRQFWAEVNLKRVNINGQDKVLAVVRDIDELKKAEALSKLKAETEQALLEEKLFSESAINSLPGIFYLFDETGRLIRWNENFERVSEYTREEIARMRPTDFFKEDAVAVIARAVQGIFTRGEVIVEAAFTSKSGKKRMYFFTGKKVTISGKNYAVGMGMDITERKNIEQELRESESRYRNIVDNIADAMYSYDFSGQIIDVNSNACKMLGYSKEELVGASLAKIDARESAPQIQIRIAQLRDKGQMVFESTQRDKNGQVIAVNISARVASREGAGRIQSFVRNISGQQTAQDELRRKIKDLELFYKVAVGREIKMIEMKKEITRLEGRLAELMAKQNK